jgi:hypothetical protein
MITYRLRHPQLSQPLEMESAVERTDRALIAWATMYILREFDEMVTREGWTVEVVPGFDGDIGCEVFLLCENAATTTVPNSVLGDVPACQRCADKMEALS